MLQNHGHLAQLAWTGAAVALAYAVQLGNGHLHLDAIPMLTIALVLSTAAVVGPRRVQLGRRWDLLVIAGLIAGLGFQFWHLLSIPPAIYLKKTSEAALSSFRYGVMTAAVLSGLLAAARRRRQRLVAMSLLLAVHFVLGVWLIRASPRPFIDTYYFQRDAVDALLSGKNPYGIDYPNIYPDESAYGVGLFVNQRSTFGYPYTPLPLWFATFGKLLGGDFRYSQLVAMTASGVLIAMLGSGQTIALLAAALLLFTPRGFFVLEQSWIEPYAVCLLAAVALCARRGWAATPWITGLFLVVKQYMFLALPLIWLLPKSAVARGWKPFLLKAAVSGAAVTVPLFLLGPEPFIRAVVVIQFLQPFRPDALSFAAYWASQGTAQVSQYSLFLAAGCAIALSLWRSPRTTAGFSGAVALTYLSFFELGKQAFCNYYYFVIGALCCAVAAATRGAEVELDIPPAHENSSAS